MNELTKKLSRKAVMLIDLNAIFTGRPLPHFSTSLNAICAALSISSENTNHYYEAMNLIKDINPEWYESTYEFVDGEHIRKKQEFCSEEDSSNFK